MGTQAIENLLRGINKQLGILIETSSANKSVAIIQRCSGNGTPIYGFISQKEDTPTLLFYMVTGDGELVLYDGVITQC
jgi:hypothetical protein